ncbi:MAG: hypothetical protein AAF921_04585 [Cyanobacteria bacterium P01_D01_bin.44]
MLWLMLLAIALVLMVLDKHLKPADEVYTIAIYSAGLLSALWGLAMAPSTVLMGLGTLALGWLQMSSPRA